MSKKDKQDAALALLFIALTVAAAVGVAGAIADPDTDAGDKLGVIAIVLSLWGVAAALALANISGRPPSA